MADKGNRGYQPDPDVHISYEDQLKINAFARLNARFDDLKSEINAKQSEMNNIKDAIDDLFLLDDDEELSQIPYMTGDVFIHMSVPEAKEELENAQEKIKSETEAFNTSMGEIKEKMSALKTQLYGKFGSHINLEGDDD